MFKRIFQWIFQITNIGNHKVITLFGIKIRIKRKSNFTGIENAVKDYNNFSTSLKNMSFYLFQNAIYEKYKNDSFDVENLLHKIKYPPTYMRYDKNNNYLNILLGFDEYEHDGKFRIQDVVLIWELFKNWDYNKLKIAEKALLSGKKPLFVGDGFLRSVANFMSEDIDLQYKKGISFTLDDLTTYFDATKMSRLEQMLNDKNLIITDEQKERARKCIDKIVETHLTKYNHQPIFEPKIGREGVKKVLVVDQSYGDMSIIKGLGDDFTFENMLAKAIDENPDADIIVKTHPDTIAGCKGYYQNLKPNGNIYAMTEPINPISIIKYVDKVYVCSSQFGFEALMCGKEVHTFGMPFYSGWGLTIDAQTCERRTNTRSLEEVFYIAYIMYSHYVNPKTKKRCEIEDAMDYLLEIRDEYFREVSMGKV